MSYLPREWKFLKDKDCISYLSAYQTALHTLTDPHRLADGSTHHSLLIPGNPLRVEACTADPPVKNRILVPTAASGRELPSDLKKQLLGSPGRPRRTEDASWQKDDETDLLVGGEGVRTLRPHGAPSEVTLLQYTTALLVV